MKDIMTDELLKSAQDALDLGFHIFPCAPKSKQPMTPNGFKNAKRDASILKAWKDGISANPAISCGDSNIAVVDCDHGLNSFEDFERWRLESGFPETFTVRTGRRDGYGVQMYFKGAVPTCAFSLNGVTGEIKSTGGYVMAAGCIHPISGERYEVIVNKPIAEATAYIKAISSIKQKGEFKRLETVELIPAGQRWIHLQSKAGTFRNAGLDEEGIYTALKNYAANNCEDGENYPEQKFRDLARAAVTKFDRADTGGVVSVGLVVNEELETKIAAEVAALESWPKMPEDSYLNGYLGELTNLITEGNTLPKALANSYLRVIAGLMLDGHVGWPGSNGMHTRFWGINVAVAGSGKGELWKRLAGEDVWSDEYGLQGVLQPVLQEWACDTISGVGSGEGLINRLKISSNWRAIMRMDELSSLFEKSARQGSTLLSNLRSLYDSCKLENTTVSRGIETIRVRMGFSADIQPSVLEKVMGSGDLREGGFLRRIFFAHHGVTGIGIIPELTILQFAGIENVVLRIAHRIKEMKNYGTDMPPTGVIIRNSSYVPPFRPVISEEVRQLVEAFVNELEAAAQNGDDTVSGLHEFLTREALIRTIMSDNPQEVSVETVKGAIAWVRYQWDARKYAWVESTDERSIAMDTSIRHVLEKFGSIVGKKYGLPDGMTKADVITFSNARKKHGGLMMFESIWKLLISNEIVEHVGSFQSKKKGATLVPVYKLAKK